MSQATSNNLPEVGAVLREKSERDIQPPRVYLLNALSPSMFTRESLIYLEPITVEEAIDILSQGFISAVGHESTAKLLSKLLKMKVEKNRIQVRLNDHDEAVIVVLGFRPEEGKVYSYDELLSLYQEKKINFYYVAVRQYNILDDFYGGW